MVFLEGKSPDLWLSSRRARGSVQDLQGPRLETRFSSNEVKKLAQIQGEEKWALTPVPALQEIKRTTVIILDFMTKSICMCFVLLLRNYLSVYTSIKPEIVKLN